MSAKLATVSFPTVLASAYFPVLLAQLGDARLDHGSILVVRRIV
ncbi:hypothetical protein ACI2L1_40180 [Streptomyces sp. NPDC019531]